MSFEPEYSDDDDVPPADRLGQKVWDYFFIPKADLIRGMHKIDTIFRRDRGYLFSKLARANCGANPMEFKFVGKVRMIKY